MGNSLKFIAAICLFACEIRSVVTLNIKQVEKSGSASRNMYSLEGEELTRHTMRFGDYPMAVSLTSTEHPEFDAVLCTIIPVPLRRLMMDDPNLKMMFDRKQPLPDPQDHFDLIFSEFKDMPVWQVMTSDDSDAVVRIFDQKLRLTIHATGEEKKEFWHITFEKFITEILPAVYMEAVEILKSQPELEFRGDKLNLRGEALRNSMPVLMQETSVGNHPEMTGDELRFEHVAKRIAEKFRSAAMEEVSSIMDAILIDGLENQKVPSTTYDYFNFIIINNKARERKPIESSDDPATSSS